MAGPDRTGQSAPRAAGQGWEREGEGGRTRKGEQSVEFKIAFRFVKSKIEEFKKSAPFSFLKLKFCLSLKLKRDEVRTTHLQLFSKDLVCLTLSG